MDRMKYQQQSLNNSIEIEIEHAMHTENEHHFELWNEPIFDFMHTNMDIQLKSTSKT